MTTPSDLAAPDLDTRAPRRLVRTTGVLLVSLLVLVVGSVPVAAETTDHRAEARGGGILLELFGQDDLTIEGASTTALLVARGDAAARGVGFRQVEESISEVDIRTGSARDPESGDNCALELPEPLDDLGLTLACSNAFAQAGAANSALANGELGELDLDGALVSGLVDFLLDAVLSDAAAALDEALEPLEDAAGPAVQPVIDELAPQCMMGLEMLNEQLVDPLLQQLDDIFDMDPTGQFEEAVQPLQDIVAMLADAAPQACVALLSLLSDLPEFEVILDDLADALRAALEDLDLVQLDLGSTTSAVETMTGEVSSMSAAVGVRLELPSLAALVDALESLLPGAISAITDQIDESIGDAFEDLVPAVEALLQPVLDALMLPDLLEVDEPLLVLDAGRATATAVLDRADASVDAEGTANTVIITLSSAFAALLGEENTRIEIPGGDTMSFGEDTPLASTISVVDTNEIEREVDGITLTGVRSGGVDLDLFQSEEFMGGINLELATAEALVGGVEGTPPPAAPESPDPAPAPPPGPAPLPVTGGGLALLGLLAAGGALLATRRR